MWWEEGEVRGLLLLPLLRGCLLGYALDPCPEQRLFWEQPKDPSLQLSTAWSPDYQTSPGQGGHFLYSALAASKPVPRHTLYQGMKSLESNICSVLGSGETRKTVWGEDDVFVTMCNLHHLRCSVHVSPNTPSPSFGFQGMMPIGPCINCWCFNMYLECLLL